MREEVSQATAVPYNPPKPPHTFFFQKSSKFHHEKMKALWVIKDRSENDILKWSDAVTGRNAPGSIQITFQFFCFFIANFSFSAGSDFFCLISPSSNTRCCTKQRLKLWPFHKFPICWSAYRLEHEPLTHHTQRLFFCDASLTILHHPHFARLTNIQNITLKVIWIYCNALKTTRGFPVNHACGDFWSSPIPLFPFRPRSTPSPFVSLFSAYIWTSLYTVILLVH